MIDKSKIAILTTVANLKLYKKTATIFPTGIDKIIIDGSKGMYGLDSIDYMFRKLKNKKYEWIIMADEDLFFYNSNAVFDLIEYMSKNNYDICGVRDGGVIQHRFHNPEVINTFFSIINFKNISKKYKYQSILQHQKFIPELYKDKDYKFLSYNYDIKSLKEPYYCFYFWALLEQFKFLYLETINPVGNDETGNIILDVNGKEMAFHSWYARAYEVHDDQTIRINSFLKEFDIENAAINLDNVQILKKRFFNWKKRLKVFLKIILKK